MKIRIAAVVAVVALLAGCGSGGDPQVGPPAGAQQASAGASAGSADAAAQQASGKTENLKLTQPVTVPAGPDYPGFTVTALEYRAVNEYGNRTDGVKVRFCAGAKLAGVDQPQVTDEPWQLLYSKGESTHGEIGYSEKLKPAYPDWSKPRTVQPGKCVTGWIPFTDIAGKPEAVQHSNDAVTASWKLP